MPQSPLRVLTYADSRTSSGAESVFCDVVRALSSIPDVHVTAAVPAESEILWAAVRDMDGVEAVDVPAHPAKRVPAGVWDPRRGLAVRRALAARQWDVAIVNLPSVEYGAAPLVWARGAAASWIGLIHLHQSIRATDRPLGAARDLLVRRVLRRLDHVLVVSPLGTEQVARTWGLPIESCSVLPLRARRPERIDRTTARERLSLPVEATLVGIMGRIEIGQKGHDVFVAAAERLASDDPGIRFAIVGEGPDESRLREMAAGRGLAERFHFLGTARADLAFGALDAIAFPSRFEGLPLVAIEALSVGLPGVASRVDGLAAVWPKEWTIEPDDPIALAEKLREIIGSDPERKEAVLREANQRAQRFLTDDLAPVLSPLVREIAARSEGRRPAPPRSSER